jgi:hypothetical protein
VTAVLFILFHIEKRINQLMSLRSFLNVHFDVFFLLYPKKNTMIGMDLCFHLQKIEHLYYSYFSFYNFVELQTININITFQANLKDSRKFQLI